jgi:hypothetical protein
MLSHKPIKNACLEINKAAPHWMRAALEDRVNADLLAFIRG